MTGVDVPGAVVPPGFCLREYVRVRAPRNLAFAPNGDLFVAAPATSTPGGSAGGPMNGSIVVYSDDDRDGIPTTSYFLTGLPSVHGVAFAGGYLYFSNQPATPPDGGVPQDIGLYRVRYTSGQRTAATAPELFATFDQGARWTHGLAATPSGVVYVTESTTGASVCDSRPLTGDVSIVDRATRTLVAQARGFRNPMYMRCHFRDETCIASELGEDEHRGTACNMGACALRGTTCDAPRSDCGGVCVDRQSDANHCGRCGHACGAGMSCVAGVCQAGCAPPRTMCAGTCVDTQTNPMHCGACGVTCVRGAREKLFVVRASTTYGYPCCYTQSVEGPLSDPRFNCGVVAREEAYFNIGETPFGLDWERGRWPAPFANGIFVALHGSYYLGPPGVGSRVIFAPTDPVTHAPSGEFTTFIDGWGPGSPQMRRATDIAFAPDGRMFVSDDWDGRIYWVAPMTLRRP